MPGYRNNTMSTNSKVEGLIDDLKNRILSGEFGREGRLPSFRTLATQYKTTQETMNKTMQALQAEGLLTSMGSKGVFVNAPQVRLLGFVPYFYQYLTEQYPDAIEEYIEKPNMIKAPTEVALALNISDETNVIRRFKRQRTPQTVYRLEDTFYPQDLLTQESEDRIMNEVSYIPYKDITKKTGYYIFDINEKIVTRLPSIYEQKLIKIVRTNPIIDIKRTAYSLGKKKVIYYQHLILNANHFLLIHDYSVDFWKK